MRFIKAVTANGVEYIVTILWDDMPELDSDDDTPEWAIDAGTD